MGGASLNSALAPESGALAHERAEIPSIQIAQLSGGHAAQALVHYFDQLVE